MKYIRNFLIINDYNLNNNLHMQVNYIINLLNYTLFAGHVLTILITIMQYFGVQQ